MNEIVKFTADSGALVELTPQDVVDYFCPNATTQEVGLFLQLCAAQRLNPWVGEAYLIKYGDKPAQIQAGKEAFTKRAAANPDYEGFEAGVIYTDSAGRVCRREGSAYYPTAGESLVGGWCRVYVKGKRPFYDEVALQEYSTGRSLWASKPATMIRKVALVHCLREAFPDAFAGLYSAEELEHEQMQQQRAQDAPRAADAVQVEQVAPTPASADDCELIGDMIAKLAQRRGVDFEIAYSAVFESKALRAAGYAGSDSLTDEQAKAALRLLRKWEADSKAADSAPTAEDKTDDDQPEYETE